jgi:uncharacterized membrane protein YkoI
MAFDVDKLMRARKTVDLVNACTVSIDQAIVIALATIGGRVFDVKVKEMNHKVVWRVKLLRSDERVKVYIDAGSGKIIEAKAEQVRRISPDAPTLPMSKDLHVTAMP